MSDSDTRDDARFERYLFEKQGDPDPELAALEDCLRPLGHGVEKRGRPRGASSRARVAWLAAAAAILVAAVAIGLGGGGGGPELRVVESGERLTESAWFTADEEVRTIRLGSLGRLDLEAGSRLEVRRVDTVQTRLFLERGKLHALVYADARPRFFQVDTPATRCVDLGCQYTLSVDDSGAAYVRVLTGKVAFENDGREVFVPAGASCRADPERGAGTPRFADALPAFAQALDAFDRAAAPRVERVAAIADALERGRDTLSLWHLLADPEDEVARGAERALARFTGIAADALADGRPGPTRVAFWKSRLEPSW